MTVIFVEFHPGLKKCGRVMSVCIQALCLTFTPADLQLTSVSILGGLGGWIGRFKKLTKQKLKKKKTLAIQLNLNFNHVCPKYYKYLKIHSLLT
jgi:hypothetical protein